MSQSLDRLIHNDVLKLRKIRYESRDTSKELSVLSINMVNLLNVPDERMDEFMNYSTKIMSNLQNLADRIQLLTEQNYYYVANSHTQMSDEQVVEIETIITELNKLSDNIIDVINNVAQYEEAEIDEKIGNFKKLVEQYNKIQLERVKVSPKPIKRNLLYFTILSDVDLIADNTKSLYKSLRKVFKKITKEK
jgi:Na+/phosphate symporter